MLRPFSSALLQDITKDVRPTAQYADVAHPTDGSGLSPCELARPTPRQGKQRRHSSEQQSFIFASESTLTYLLTSLTLL